MEKGVRNSAGDCYPVTLVLFNPANRWHG